MTDNTWATQQKYVLEKANSINEYQIDAYNRLTECWRILQELFLTIIKFVWSNLKCRRSCVDDWI